MKNLLPSAMRPDLKLLLAILPLLQSVLGIAFDIWYHNFGCKPCVKT